MANLSRHLIRNFSSASIAFWMARRYILSVRHGQLLPGRLDLRRPIFAQESFRESPATLSCTFTVPNLSGLTEVYYFLIMYLLPTMMGSFGPPYTSAAGGNPGFLNPLSCWALHYMTMSKWPHQALLQVLHSFTECSIIVSAALRHIGHIFVPARPRKQCFGDPSARLWNGQSFRAGDAIATVRII